MHHDVPPVGDVVGEAEATGDGDADRVGEADAVHIGQSGGLQPLPWQRAPAAG